jgi:hypothetical protein
MEGKKEMQTRRRKVPAKNATKISRRLQRVIKEETGTETTAPSDIQNSENACVNQPSFKNVIETGSSKSGGKEENINCEMNSQTKEKNLPTDSKDEIVCNKLRRSSRNKKSTESEIKCIWENTGVDLKSEKHELTEQEHSRPSRPARSATFTEGEESQKMKLEPSNGQNPVCDERVDDDESSDTDCAADLPWGGNVHKATQLYEDSKVVSVFHAHKKKRKKKRRK